MPEIEHHEVPLASYGDCREAERLTDLALARLTASRRILVAQGGVYGRKVGAGFYRDDSHSYWQIFAVADPGEVAGKGIDTVVLWREVDDGSFSFHFAAGETKPRFFCYEN